MSQFFRIKNFVINLESVAFVRVEKDYIDFGFGVPPPDNVCGPNCLRLERGTTLQDAEFEQVKEFVLQLPDVDRVIVI
jgi:hypothetical protein